MNQPAPSSQNPPSTNLSTSPAPDDYSDIIHLPRPVSKTRPRMSKSARAAQFAPYAALVGHRDLIKDTEEEKSRDLDELIILNDDNPSSFDGLTLESNNSINANDIAPKNDNLLDS